MNLTLPFSITGNFSQTTTCGATLAAQASCTINVTFTPTAVGTSTGALMITDNAPNSPQMVTLSGAGGDFGVAISPTSASVVAGNSTGVTVTVTSVSGYSAAVSLACTGLPALASCSPSPASVTPASGGAATASLTISTTRRTSTPPRGAPWPQGPGGITHPGIWLLAAVLLGLSGWALRKNRWRYGAVLVLAALWLATFAACGGGGNGYVNPTGTPSGTYTVSVTGTSAGLSHSTNLTLTVQ